MAIAAIKGIGIENDGHAIVLHYEGERFRIEAASDLIMAMGLLGKIREILEKPIVKNGGPEVIGLPIDLSWDDAANQVAHMAQPYGPLVSKVGAGLIRQAPVYAQKLADWLQAPLEQEDHR